MSTLIGLIFSPCLNDLPGKLHQVLSWPAVLLAMSELFYSDMMSFQARDQRAVKDGRETKRSQNTPREEAPRCVRCALLPARRPCSQPTLLISPQPRARPEPKPARSLASR